MRFFVLKISIGATSCRGVGVTPAADAMNSPLPYSFFIHFIIRIITFNGNEKSLNIKNCRSANTIHFQALEVVGRCSKTQLG